MDSPPARTSLDTSPLTVDQHTTDTPEQEWRFRRCTPERIAYLSALPKLLIDHKYKQRFRACGSDAWVEHSPTSGRFRVIVTRCKLRFCPACARARAAHITDWCKQCVDATNRKTWKFVTLTLRHSRQPLAEQIEHLKQSFRRLRQQRIWKSSIQGGIAVIEIKRNTKTGEWHPHLHCVAKGKYIKGGDLSAAWKIASRGSFIVDIKAIHNAEEAGLYLGKYITKPADPLLFPDTDVLSEYLNAIMGTRLFIRFGDIPTYDEDEMKEQQPTDWKRICPLSSALAEAKAGNPYYQAMLTALDGVTDEPFDPDDFETWESCMPPVPEPSG